MTEMSELDQMREALSVMTVRAEEAEAERDALHAQVEHFSKSSFDGEKNCTYCHGIGACPRCWGRAGIAKLEDALQQSTPKLPHPEDLGRLQAKLAQAMAAFNSVMREVTFACGLPEGEIPLRPVALLTYQRDTARAQCAAMREALGDLSAARTWKGNYAIIQKVLATDAGADFLKEMTKNKRLVEAFNLRLTRLRERCAEAATGWAVMSWTRSRARTHRPSRTCCSTGLKENTMPLVWETDVDVADGKRMVTLPSGMRAAATCHHSRTGACGACAARLSFALDNIERYLKVGDVPTALQIINDVNLARISESPSQTKKKPRKTRH